MDLLFCLSGKNGGLLAEEELREAISQGKLGGVLGLGTGRLSAICNMERILKPTVLPHGVEMHKPGSQLNIQLA